MNDTATIPTEWLILGVRAAGAFHLITLVVACFTPIPANWGANLRLLPEIHRRFALAQNVAIGGVIAFLGVVCLCFAPTLVEGSTGGRILCAAVSLWWGGRLVILPWLGVRVQLTNTVLRLGFVCLVAECAFNAVAFAWLAGR